MAKFAFSIVRFGQISRKSVPIFVHVFNSIRATCNLEWTLFNYYLVINDGWLAVHYEYKFFSIVINFTLSKANIVEVSVETWINMRKKDSFVNYQRHSIFGWNDPLRLCLANHKGSCNTTVILTGYPHLDISPTFRVNRWMNSEWNIPRSLVLFIIWKFSWLIYLIAVEKFITCR